MRRKILFPALKYAIAAWLGFLQSQATAAERQPNILWIVAEDLSPWFGCYGSKVNRDDTPVIDKMAAEGVLFKRAYSPAPVCSAARSALITGMMQTTTGTQEHRSSRTTDGEVVPEELRIYLPEGVRTLPEMMKDAGYFTFNSGKDDYNFHYNRLELYDVGTSPDYRVGQNGWQGNRAEHWKSYTRYVWGSRPDKSQPWFGQIQIDGGKGDKKFIPASKRVDRSSVKLPPYFPDTPALREAWTAHYDNARGSDVIVSRIIEQLKQDEELENTVIFFFSDHGSNTSLRHKQFCYEGGMHVPLIVWGKHPSIVPGKVVNDLVSLLDVTASTLKLAGVDLPNEWEGQPLWGEGYRPAQYIIGARDRCDYTIDQSRTVRTDRFRYIRNYYPDRPLLQAGYRDKRPAAKDLRRLYTKEELTPYQKEHWFGVRPFEELYDIARDPHQMDNLALDPRFASDLIEHRKLLSSWQFKTDDKGLYPESNLQLEATYELWKDLPIFRDAEVNPEYERFGP
ncbi:MAG: sulfatase [Verrucomicrobiota bacterium]